MLQKLSNFRSSKDAVKRIIRPRAWENMFANHISDLEQFTPDHIKNPQVFKTTEYMIPFI